MTFEPYSSIDRPLSQRRAWQVAFSRQHGKASPSAPGHAQKTVAKTEAASAALMLAVGTACTRLQVVAENPRRWARHICAYCTRTTVRSWLLHRGCTVSRATVQPSQRFRPRRFDTRSSLPPSNLVSYPHLSGAMDIALRPWITTTTNAADYCRALRPV